MSRGTPSIDYHNRLSRAEALMKYSDQIQKFYFYIVLIQFRVLFRENAALYCVYLVCGKICQIYSQSSCGRFGLELGQTGAGVKDDSFIIKTAGCCCWQARTILPISSVRN